MKTNKKNLHRHIRWMCGMGLCLVAATAWGGIVPPLYVGNLEPVLDEYGRTMAGSLSADHSNTRSLVELRTSTKNLILPALPSGEAHPFNPLLSADSIGGVGLNSSSPDSGLFCLVLSERPAVGTKIFARVYNAPTVEEASFYADSSFVEATTTGNSLTLEFSAAQALDTNDVDGDGLNNSWEKALGIDDRETSDYDGDGMSDLHEMLAGTAADDSTSQMSFQLIRREPPRLPSGEVDDQTWQKPVRVRWQSVPGKTYQLEYVPMLIQLTGEDPIFVPVGEEIVADDGEFEIEMLVDVPEDEATGSFRIRLVVEE
jgi:thrombospondin type 3 repeat protein